MVFASAAYLGDVAPFVEPAKRLADAGHDVTFLAPAGYHDFLNGHRFALATYPLDFSARAMHADPRHARLMRHPFANQIRLGRYWMRAGLLSDPEAGKASMLAALRGADVVVAHPTFGSVAAPAAEHLDIPLVVGQLFPMMMPTAKWAPPIPIQSRNFGRTANRLAWRAFAYSSGKVLHDRGMNAYRRSLGVRPLHGAALMSWTTAARTVVMVSRHYFGPEPDDWRDWSLAGFSPWPGPPVESAEPAVQDFLDQGDPPVLVCLGTSAASGAGETFATIARGLDARGQRSLLLVGDAANLSSLGGRRGAFAFAPVTPLLPRCRAAVVSGALGTLAAALTAGLPVVVLPQLFDQVWHGRRVEALGVGRMVLRAADVPNAVAQVLHDPEFAQRARELGAKLAAEDGADGLVQAVSSLL